MLDGSIVHTTARSYVLQNKAPGSAVAEREQSKLAHYRDLVAQEGCPVIPFVMDSYGRLGRQAVEFLRRVAQHAARSTEERIAFYQRALALVSFALQTGNAEVAAAGAAQLRVFDRVPRTSAADPRPRYRLSVGVDASDIPGPDGGDWGPAEVASLFPAVVSRAGSLRAAPLMWLLC